MLKDKFLTLANAKELHYTFPMSTLINIILSNFIISLISFVGVLTLASEKLRSKQMIGVFVSFAAGTLLTSAFVNILHEALESGSIDTVLLLTLCGMIFSFFLERFFVWHHHHHEDMHNMEPSAWLVIIGDGVHNFIDGLAIAATFLASPITGWATTLAVAAHEIPQEVADFSVLRHSGVKIKKALWLNFLSALTAILGGIVGFYSIQRFDHMLPLALGFTAGIFIYLASADLIPSLHEDYHAGGVIKQVVPFVVGVIMILFLSNLFGNG
jgi:zinc and cadmium transporter